MPTHRFSNFAAVVLCTLFVAIGALWIAQPGLQTDEALFAAGIYPPFEKRFLCRVFGSDVSLMVMSYVGVLKGWLWRMIFIGWPPSPASVRLPALLVGAVTIWMFYRLMLRTTGTRAALAGCALLATDTSFLWTTRLDWGPTAIQHFCLVGSLLAFVHFEERHRDQWLALGFFLLGLGLWDKAVLLWSLAGLLAGVGLVFRREFRKAWTLRTVAVAVISFGLGALPLIVYNIQHDLATFRGNSGWSSQLFGYKASMLLATWEGSALLRAIPREDKPPSSSGPEDRAKQWLLAINEAAGSPRKNLLLPALLASLGLLPFVWHRPARRPVLFALVFTSGTFLAMALTKDAGASAHHSVLVWPLPHLVVAAVLAEVCSRHRFGGLGLLLLTSALCFSNVLVTSTYYTNLLKNGSTVAWSDAIYPLSASLHSPQPNRVCLLDWGFLDNLRLLHQGKLVLCIVDDLATDSGRQIARALLAEANDVFVAHTEQFAIESAPARSFFAFLAKEGYQKSQVQIFSDSNGRPTIELFRLRKTTAD